MVSFRELTGGQLEKMLANTELEIKRRKNIKAAATEIRSVLKKYKITIQDIDLQSFDKRTAKKTVSKGKAQAKANDNRQRVKSKYANPNGVETWSGRGRAPAWVLEVCQKEEIDLAAFKKDARFIKG